MYTMRPPSIRTTLSAVAFATVQHPSRHVRRPREPRRVLPADPSPWHAHRFVGYVQPCRSLGTGRDARPQRHSVRPGLVVCGRGVCKSRSDISNDSFCVFGYQSDIYIVT
ncbi:hypothetical protein, variant [Aphanomyces astaci]|nr:hypothetical protein, variant [Aphanomyces astaci]ETV85378.1 hypothetical protein, variant [Aphanomyces astaci]|eukprot:XP_009825396.1 hypothetical protein, variant [Aphanomyces astaci]